MRQAVGWAVAGDKARGWRRRRWPREAGTRASAARPAGARLAVGSPPAPRRTHQRDGQDLVRRHARRRGVQQALALADAHAARAQVAQALRGKWRGTGRVRLRFVHDSTPASRSSSSRTPAPLQASRQVHRRRCAAAHQDALAVGHHHHAHVLLRVAAQLVQEGARVGGAQVQAVGGHADAVVPAGRGAGRGGRHVPGMRPPSARRVTSAAQGPGSGIRPAAPTHVWQASPTVGVYTKGRISSVCASSRR